jgi:hypothetical protein
MSATSLFVASMVCLLLASAILAVAVWQQRQRRLRIRRECERSEVRDLADSLLGRFNEVSYVRGGVLQLRELWRARDGRLGRARDLPPAGTASGADARPTERAAVSPENAGVLWIVLAVAATVYSAYVQPRRFARGILTRKLVAPLMPPTLRQPPYVGAGRMFFSTVLAIPTSYLLSMAEWEPVFYGLYVLAFVVDDWLTGDDRWKRRFKALRNKIRWRMALPTPAPGPS